MNRVGEDTGRYTLGDSATERQRLALQSRRLEMLTRRFLQDAGVVQGMRVLELGTGLGDVSCLLAGLVGDTGQVVSLERSDIMLDEARRNVAGRCITNVQFIQCDLNNLRLNAAGSFDAIVGRLILTHLSDPAATLRRASAQLIGGGIVAFQETDFTLSEQMLWLSRDRLPLAYQVSEWIDLARNDAGMRPRTGSMLHRIFVEAGLPSPTVHFHTELYAGNRPDRIRNTVNILRDLTPRLAAHGVSGDMMRLETLEERLTAEAVAADAVQALASIASAWAVKGREHEAAHGPDR